MAPKDMAAKETKPRLRLASVIVQVEMMLDDGTYLTPVTTDPQRIPAQEWNSFSLDQFVSMLQAQYESGQLAIKSQPASRNGAS